VPYALTVVNDGSDPYVAQVLNAYAGRSPCVRVLHNPENFGYTRSANLAMAHATADWMVLLNSDTLVTPGWLEGLLECAASDPAIKFVGPLSNAASWQSVPELFDVRGRWSVNPLPAGYSPEDMAALVASQSLRQLPCVPLLNGFCTLMDRRVVTELGFLDEIAFPVGYGEENDLCLRAVKAGHRLAIADHVYVYHAKSASFGIMQREQLSKAGSTALAQKHPDIDLKRIQAEMADQLALITLRRTLSTYLGGHS